MSQFTGVEFATEIAEAIRFRSGALSLEGRFDYPESGDVCGAVALAGPHPMLGGDLDNNVVRGLRAGLARRGVAVLSFNYRGVGGSEGAPPDVTASLAQFWATSHTADEEHYAADFRAAAAELTALVGPDLPSALVGYSFGCSILTAADDLARPLVLVAPTVGQHDYGALARVPNPVLVIAPDGDFAAGAGAVTEWFATVRGPKCLVRGDWDAHFFRGHEERLAEAVFAFLRGRWEVDT
jgi:alpha/beta superfamily hydrolase